MRVELAERRVDIDEERCNGCATCAQMCPTGVLDVIGRKAKVSRPEDCMGCQLCEVECPMEAIKVQRIILRLREERPQERVPAAVTTVHEPPKSEEAEPKAPAPPGVQISPPSPSGEGVMIRGKPLAHYFRSERVKEQI
jgi:NAD-dependent dihydropyrimidine dehydrogenase PreA subunit